MKRLSLILFALLTQLTVMAQFDVKPLPYGYDALAPQISEETMQYHHGKHYAGYIAKLNQLTGGTPYAQMTLEDAMLNADGDMFNNAAQAWNHEFYFAQLSKNPQTAPTGKLAEAINAKFGSLSQFKDLFNGAAVTLFGSGWVWLVSDDAGALSIVSEPNAGNPLVNGLKPLLTFDIWEHAYYIDHRNNRSEAISKLWEVIDWKVIDSRY